MRSSSASRSVIVGIFTLLGVAILAITILTLGSQKKTFTESILVKSYFPNVNGLQKGNNIWYTGVKVGTIRSVTMVEGGLVEVKMNIDEVAKKFIHTDAKAKLSSDGLIGNKIIEIYGGSAQSPSVKDGDILQGDKLFSTDELMNTLSKNNDNLLAITGNLKTITSQIAEGKGTIGKFLTDETLANQINQLAASLNKSATNIEVLSKAAADYTAKLNKPGSLANDLVTDTSIFNNLRNISKQLAAVTDSSKMVISNLNATTNSLKNGLQNTQTPIGYLLNDKNASVKIRTTLTNLQSASKKLDEDLEALQHNFLLKGFFKKKEKLEKANQRVVLDTTVGN